MSSRAGAAVPEREVLSKPEVVARYVYLRYGRFAQEVMGALYVCTRHRLLGERELFRGTLHRTSVEPPIILREGLLLGAAGVILFHSHPSGDPAPSREDIAFTRRMWKAGTAVGIELVDHLVVAEGGRWESIKDRGGW